MLRQTLGRSQAVFPASQGAANWLMTETQQSVKDVPQFSAALIFDDDSTDSSPSTTGSKEAEFKTPYPVTVSMWKRFVAAPTRFKPERRSYANDRMTKRAVSLLFL